MLKTKTKFLERQRPDRNTPLDLPFVFFDAMIYFTSTLIRKFYLYLGVFLF